MPPRRARLVVLASGSGTTLQAILDDPVLAERVVAAGADRPGTSAMHRAEQAGIATFIVPFANYPQRSDWNRAFEAALRAHAPDLVVLAGFMRIFDAQLVTRFGMVNTHPALLPEFPGAHAIRDALAARVARTGVTVHWVDEGVDTGAIIAQAPVDVDPRDTEDTLRGRVQTIEKPLYVNTIRTLCQEIES